MKAADAPIVYRNIPELMRGLDLPKPRHPLIALVNYDMDKINRAYAGQSFLIHFYKVSFKKNFKGQVKYGQGYYDFEEGGLAFLAPGQLVKMSGDETNYEGYTLYFHPDLIRNYQLAGNITRYGFFSYAVNEALFLSEKEKSIINTVFESIATELENNTDAFSQDVLVSQIELLLNYSNRFYSRQFFTRKSLHHQIIDQLDQLLSEHFSTQAEGLPAVQQMADQLHVSARYLTDMLKSLTGKSTRQFIHDRLIEQAKKLLSNTGLSISEIAYKLGFEHPQSFNKLFKKATDLSPNAFRQSFI
jgi:AraC-like DNA-binding protein